MLSTPIPPPNQANIPLPAKLRTSADQLTALPENATASFSITYVANGVNDAFGNPCITFLSAAQTAFNAAAAVWSNLLQSSVPITINACWSTLGPGVLGQSGGGNLTRDFPGAPRANTWYVASLANALAGSDLVPSNVDMHITFSSAFTWYTGTDGATPSEQYDLMTVTLHEIGHGLNFMGSMDVAAGSGSWGNFTGFPYIYDTFMSDKATDPSNLLITTGVYPNSSAALATALTSNSSGLADPMPWPPMVAKELKFMLLLHGMMDPATLIWTTLLLPVQ